MRRALATLAAIGACALPAAANSGGMSFAMYYTGADGTEQKALIHWTVYDGKTASKAECEKMLPAMTAMEQADLDKRGLGKITRSECIDSDGSSSVQE